MHSCWSILYFVLIAFGLKLFVFKMLFEKCLGKEKGRKRKTPASPCLVSPAAQFPPPCAQSARVAQWAAQWAA